jgi:hypothetical protein
VVAGDGVAATTTGVAITIGGDGDERDVICGAVAGGHGAVDACYNNCSIQQTFGERNDDNEQMSVLQLPVQMMYWVVTIEV